MSASVLVDELCDAIPDGDGDPTDELALRVALDSFLASLSKRERKIFVKRYFLARELETIAREEELSLSNVKVILYRTRLALKEKLEKEGIIL